jgi:outer membrane protein
VNLATASLANALALDQNTPLETVAVKDPAVSAEAYDAGVEEAYRNRPEIMQTDAYIHAAEKGVYLANRSLLPTMSLAWSMAYQPDAAGLSPKTTSWAAIATIKLPLFEGGTAAARRQQSRADLNTARIAKQQVMDGVALAVRQAHLAVIEAQERAKVAIAALTQAEEQYRLAGVRFKAGVTSTTGGSPLLEISDARTALSQAQTNRINSLYDLAGAQAKYDSALGRYAYDGTSTHGLAGPVTGGKK